MTANLIQTSDENTHIPGPHEHWNESFYFNFFDVNKKWSGASRIGFSPNRGFADGFIMLYFPDNTSGFIRTWENCSEHGKNNNGGVNSIGALQHICNEPFKQWQLKYEGPIYYFSEPESMADFSRSMLADVPQKQIKLEITFTPFHSPFDFHDSMRKRLIPWRELIKKFSPSYFFRHLRSAMLKLRLVRVMSGASHYEQGGCIKGSITLEGKTTELEGYGQRDHSWGVRDMRVPSNWRWLSCQFDESFCFNATQVDVLALRVSGGYVYQDGELDLLSDWACKPHYTDNKRWPDSVEVTLTTQQGKRIQLHGKAVANIPVLLAVEGDVVQVTESRGLYEWEGRQAYGIIEFMEQIK